MKRFPKALESKKEQLIENNSLRKLTMSNTLFVLKRQIRLSR